MITWYWKGKRLCREDVEAKLRDKKLILFGADIRRNQYLFEEIDRDRILCIFDNDKEKWGEYQQEIRITEPSKANGGTVLISGIHDWKAISRQAGELGYEEPFFFLTEDMEAAAGKYISYFSPSVYDNGIRPELSIKYIHFIPDEKFFVPVIEFIEYGLDIKDHFFVIYGVNGGNRNDLYGTWGKYRELSEKYHNIYLYYEERCRLNLDDWADNRDKLDLLLEKAEKIIFHGEFFTQGIYEYFRKRLSAVSDKGIFIPWGGGLGINPYTTHIVNEVLQFVRMIPYSVSKDKDLFIQYFPYTQNTVWVKTALSYARLTEYPLKMKKEGRNILIAHSAHSYTGVLEAAEYLADVTQPVRIYCITSYGPEKLVREIRRRGKQYFGDRFISVGEYMDYKEYVYFLSQMDAAVFAMDTLSGRDTLEILFWLGAKVYLKPESKASERMRAAGYKVKDYYAAKQDIAEQRFDNEDERWNHSIAANEFDARKKLEQWRDLYEYDFSSGKE